MIVWRYFAEWKLFFWKKFPPDYFVISIDLFLTWCHPVAEIIWCMRPANERRRYIVTSSIIGWVHTQNDPCSRCGRSLLHVYFALSGLGDWQHRTRSIMMWKKIAFDCYYNVSIVLVHCTYGMRNICHHCFRFWLATSTVPSHYLNHSCFTVDWAMNL